MQNAYSECTLNDVCPQACRNGGGGGALVFEVGYHPRKKKNHVIRLVFQDQAMYVRTSFRGVKTGKMGGGVFLAMVSNFGEDVTDTFSKSTQKRVFIGSVFMPGKYVLCVCFKSPFTRMISSLKYTSAPPLPVLSQF